MRFKRGDIFCSRGKGVLASIIRRWEALWSSTSNVYFNHAGILVNSDTTFEALWKYEHRDFYKEYGGCEVFVARPKFVPYKTINWGIDRVENWKKGKFYPGGKLLTHIFPPATKLFPNDPVCSELAAAYGWLIEALPFFNGMNPDMLNNILCVHYAWEIVFWGILERR